MNGLTSAEAADQMEQHGASRLQPATQRAVLPPSIFVLLSGLLIAYLLAVEGGKQ